MAGVYDEDLASIHDAGFGQVARGAASLLKQELSTRFRQGLVVDLGCGSGILLAEMAKAGYQTRGIDLSESMIGLARSRVPGGTFEQGSIWDAQIPACVAVTAIGEVFGYLFDPRAAEQNQLDRVFTRIGQALLPGGVLLFDLAGPGRVPGAGESRQFLEGEGWAVLVHAKEDRQQRTLSRRITSYRRRQGQLYGREVEEHRLRLYDQREVLGVLRAQGFRAKALRGYGDFRFPRGWTGYLASRPRGKTSRE